MVTRRSGVRLAIRSNTASGVGIGKDIYRETLAAIASWFSNLFGGDDVSFETRTGRSVVNQDSSVHVDGRVEVGINREQWLTIALDGSETHTDGISVLDRDFIGLATDILDRISALYAETNRLRAEARNRRRNLGSAEAAAAAEARAAGGAGGRGRDTGRLRGLHRDNPPIGAACGFLAAVGCTGTPDAGRKAIAVPQNLQPCHAKKIARSSGLFLGTGVADSQMANFSRFSF